MPGGAALHATRSAPMRVRRASIVVDSRLTAAADHRRRADDSSERTPAWMCPQSAALPKPLSKADLRGYLRQGPPLELRKAFWLASVHAKVSEGLQAMKLARVSLHHLEVATKASQAVAHHAHVPESCLAVNPRAVARVALGAMACANQGRAQFCAPVMSLSALLLTLLTEVQATAVVATMLRKWHSGVLLMVMDRNTFSLLLHAFDDTLLKLCPKVAAQVVRRGAHSSLLVADWFSSLWIGSLPFDLVLRVVDSFVYQVHPSPSLLGTAHSTYMFM